ncbi:MAG: hypothetical protein ACREA9_04185 [Pyrinomonadaceae bacterium]
MGEASDNDSPYWLFGWLEANRVNTSEELRAILGRPSSLRELRDVAEAWRDAEPETPSQGINLVAGTGLRLDDLLTCPNLPCRLQQVDVLFRHAWHYFDRILLPDGVGNLLINRANTRNDKLFHELLFSWIELTMYIRDLGATELVSYYPKHGRAPKGFLDRVIQKGAEDFQNAIVETQDEMIRKGEFLFEQKSRSRFQVFFADPLLAVGRKVAVTIPKGRAPTKNT